MNIEQKNLIDEAVNDLSKVNYRLTFLKEISNLEDNSEFNVNEIENYGYGKSLIVEDLQSEINRIINNIQEISK